MQSKIANCPDIINQIGVTSRAMTSGFEAMCMRVPKSGAVTVPLIIAERNTAVIGMNEREFITRPIGQYNASLTAYGSNLAIGRRGPPLPARPIKLRTTRISTQD